MNKTKYFKPVFAIAVAVSFFSLCSCTRKTDEINTAHHNLPPKEVTKKSFQKIIDSANVTGSILILDPKENIYYSNDFEWSRKGFLPASTFKIPNTIIALESGAVESDTSLFVWNGEKRSLPEWEKDLTLKEAFRVSCVPCYQEIARKIGTEKMKDYIGKFNYGKMVIDSATIDKFWLEGESAISQKEQIDFLKKFYSGELSISEKTFLLMKKILIIESNEKYTFSGKTGWSIRNGNNNGWFVGSLETGGKIFYVATNIIPREDFNMQLFAKIRTQISFEAFKNLNLL